MAAERRHEWPDVLYPRYPIPSPVAAHVDTKHNRKPSNIATKPLLTNTSIRAQTQEPGWLLSAVMSGLTPYTLP